MSGLGEGYKEPYGQQPAVTISLALKSEHVSCLRFITGHRGLTSRWGHACMMALLNYFHNLWSMSGTYILSQFDISLEYLGGGLKL